MNVIVDTGPLVALMNRKDPFHPWAVETVQALAAPLLTCEAVLTEVSDRRSAPIIFG